MNFDLFTLAFLFLCFIWSGFARTAFGFGGNALMLPIALLVVSNPIIIIPVVAMQGIFFNGFEVVRNFRRIDWRSLVWIFLILVPGVAAGLYGLIKLPDYILAIAVYAITIGYAASYLFQWKIKTKSKLLDLASLLLGGYITGFSLTGGPPIVAVAMKYIARQFLRNSMMALWVLVSISKVTTFVLADVNLQLFLLAFTLPAVVIGHSIGLRFHDRIMQNKKFYQILGGVLLIVSIVGIFKTIF